MSENEEVTSSDIVDMVIEHLNDIKALNVASKEGGYRVSWAKEETNKSYDRLQLKLDQYVDQRIMKKLAECRLIKIVDPMD